jgi:hypothetical protein
VYERGVDGNGGWGDTEEERKGERENIEIEDKELAEQEEIKRDNSIRDLRIKIQSTEICIKKLDCDILI